LRPAAAPICSRTRASNRSRSPTATSKTSSSWTWSSIREDSPAASIAACTFSETASAAERARKRGELLDATQALLEPIAARAAAGKLAGADQIDLKVGQVINKHKMGKHFSIAITDTSLTITRNQNQIDAEAALDGIYVLRTDQPTDTLNTAGVVTSYKNLSTAVTRGRMRVSTPASRCTGRRPARRAAPGRPVAVGTWAGTRCVASTPQSGCTSWLPRVGRRGTRRRCARSRP
jgi:hypothetical protein